MDVRSQSQRRRGSRGQGKSGGQHAQQPQLAHVPNPPQLYLQQQMYQQQQGFAMMMHQHHKDPRRPAYLAVPPAAAHGFNGAQMRFPSVGGSVMQHPATIHGVPYAPVGGYAGPTASMSNVYTGPVVAALLQDQTSTTWTTPAAKKPLTIKTLTAEERERAKPAWEKRGSSKSTSTATLVAKSAPNVHTFLFYISQMYD